MQLHFLVTSSDEMVHDMRCGCVTSGAAEPLGAGQTSDDRAWIVYSAVAEKAKNSVWL